MQCLSYQMLSATMIHIVYVPNVQFSAIEKIMQSMKKYPSIVYMVPYEKVFFFQMRYREGQVDYFGKKGMCLLGMI